MTFHATDAPSSPRRWHWWLPRALAGVAFGFGCNGAVQACWVGLLVAVYGSLDTAFNDMRPTAAMQVGFAAYFASLPASFLGGLIAPLVLSASTQRRRAIMLSSVCGAVLATVAAVVLGASAAWLVWQVAPRSMVFVWIALCLGVTAGIGGGWLGGWVARRAEPAAADVTMNVKPRLRDDGR
jgi:hypothetical protein